jgi:plastocyanin
LIGRGTQSAQAADDEIIHVTAGGGEPGYAVNGFFARDITVLTGTQVHWTFDWLEPHTVTFGIPTGDPTVPTEGAGAEVLDFDGSQFISSGVTGGPDASLDLKFTTPGTYEYFCALHPLMTGEVTVVDSGDVDTQDDVDTRGDAEYAAGIAAIKAVAAQLAGQPTAVTPKAGGGNEFTVVIGGLDQYGDDAQQFFAPSLTIKEKDSVKWVSSIPTPHTVTMGALQGDPFEVPVTAPAGGYDGTGLVHSGILGVDWPAGLTFELQFNKAGSYQYFCALHAEQGMVGTITVEAQVIPPTPTPTVAPTATQAPAPTATATKVPPGPPNTGNGTGGDGGNGSLLMLAAFAGLLFIGAGTGLVAVRKNRN